MIMSLPVPSTIEFAVDDPVRTSFAGEPVGFSTRVMVSVPDPTVFCAATVARLTVMPATVVPYVSVSVPALPLMVSLPSPPLMKSFPRRR